MNRKQAGIWWWPEQNNWGEKKEDKTEWYVYAHQFQNMPGLGLNKTRMQSKKKKITLTIKASLLEDLHSFYHNWPDVQGQFNVEW